MNGSAHFVSQSLKEVAEGVDLENKMAQIAALEEQIDADHGRVIEPGGFRAVIEGVEPGTRRDCVAAVPRFAAPSAEMQVRHRLVAQAKDVKSWLAPDHDDANVEVLSVDLRHGNAALHAGPFGEQEAEH